ncbi:MAG: RtcB family protein [Candidatus Micrarchaeota archaeon]|nr:RtcB family protein [Candidatus Micrarchaeota archaeon]
MEIVKITPYLFKMKKTGRMRTEALIFATEKLLQKIKQDRTLQQLQNVASLPGIVGNALLMPDAHEGYGFPIGGVAAFDREEGIVSPGGVGFDINCGVRLLKTPLTKEEIKPVQEELAQQLFRTIPSGVGETGHLRLSVSELDLVAELGVKWAEEEGYAFKEDRERIEEYGRMEGADPSKISKTAKKRGKNQLGTLGSGNHFLEVQYVESILDEERAKKLGLFPGQVVVMIHTGSRGFGHQIASDYISLFLRENPDIPDPDLAYLPLKHDLAWDYIAAMKGAVNFAFTNRQIITHFTREVFRRMFNVEMELLYDVAHNIAKFEKHKVNGEEKEVLIHRKGATRAFPKGRPELPALYRDIGQPVIIPGSMGTASYVLLGREESLDVSFGTTCHGAGRVLSRRKATQMYKGEKLIKELAKEGIILKPKTLRGAAEEAPGAYKDIDEVIKTVVENKISYGVARLRPLAVIKG